MGKNMGNVLGSWDYSEVYRILYAGKRPRRTSIDNVGVAQFRQLPTFELTTLVAISICLLRPKGTAKQ